MWPINPTERFHGAVCTWWTLDNSVRAHLAFVSHILVSFSLIFTGKCYLQLLARLAGDYDGAELGGDVTILRHNNTQAAEHRSVRGNAETDSTKYISHFHGS